MTKTDWTKEEVSVAAEFEANPIVKKMLTAYAERIEADESAVPVGYYNPSFGSLGFKLTQIAGYVPVYLHPPAQAAQGEAVSGTFACPICGKELAHFHSAEDVCAWAAAQANRFLTSLGNPEVVIRTKELDERRTNDFRKRVADAEDMLRDAGHSYQAEYARLSAKLHSPDAADSGRVSDALRKARDYGSASWDDWLIEEVDAALAAQGQGEAVAKVRHFDYRGIARNGFSQEAEMLDGAPVLPDGTLLYTAPPARVVDVGAIREVITSIDLRAETYLDPQCKGWANKLTAALMEKAE